MESDSITNGNMHIFTIRGDIFHFHISVLWKKTVPYAFHRYAEVGRKQSIPTKDVPIFLFLWKAWKTSPLISHFMAEFRLQFLNQERHFKLMTWTLSRNYRFSAV
jgi:hypothetical protein